MDAVDRRNVTFNHRVSHWAPGTITGILNDAQDPSLINAALNDGGEIKYIIRFDGEEGVNQDTTVVWDSPFIAPLSTFTKDFQWRYGLEVGDLIDCIDTEATWYRSSVLEVEKSQKLVQPIQDDAIEDSISKPQPQTFKVKIGYRVHDPKGDKEEEDGSGRRFIGWSYRFDKWFHVADPQF